ncbi:type II secretion system protein [Rhizobacter sp. Root1221]|uniref:type II secretion system protein n=1 Tax=Rhizobacter sp. Root1221 TaxID=1736433 RepID=UPI0006F71307|nr:type II secretion system protein [Rhizobacter sp. Root1221]KQV94748.1 type II secretion system protein G [Rhizobacter sp. Root1221]
MPFRRHDASSPDPLPGRRSAGFTLIELLVVLAIVAVMLTLAIPRYYSQLDASKESVLRENLRVTRDVIDRFYGDLGRYPESLDELVQRWYLRSVPVDPMTESTDTWIITAPPEGHDGAVADIRSGSSAQTKDGKPYAEW